MSKRKPTLYIVGIIAGACLLYAMSTGLRCVYGIMLKEISAETGIAYSTVSFAIAIGQLVFGVVQPIFGMIALKKSNTFVLANGSIMMAIGLCLIPFCIAGWQLVIILGLILPVGTGAISFGLLMSAVTLKLGEEKAAAASGIINASSGVGSIAFSPILQSAFSAIGLKITLFGFAVLAALLIPVSVLVGGREKEKRDEASWGNKIIPLIKKAFTNKSYLFLMIGFFTCGFHMAIIETHLYSQIISYGISESVAALSFSACGFATIVGSLISGYLCSKIRMKWVTGTLYATRVVWVTAFLLLPKNVPTVIAFAITIGLTGAAIVTPVSGIVGKLFGAENIATLFGIVFVSHQFGSFFGTWLGGICVEATGGYSLIWCVGAVLSVVAMIVSYCINEPRKSVS